MGKMEKKESFLNLMQEQKQICEKCYLWDNDGCYCASDGRNTKVCEFFNHIDALYSDPPSEMVCPHCEGSGKFYADGKVHYAYEHISTIVCAYCNGTGKVSSPEPPEKMRLTDEEINKTRNRSIPDANVKLPKLSDSQEWLLYLDREMCKAQILKLQQAGWGDIQHILDTDAELLHEQEARIKELETEVSDIKKLMAQDKIRIGEYWEGKLAEARQQAFEEFAFKVNEWLDKYDWQMKELRKFISELPKE
jgi:RecJ-like exonuclease